MAKYNEITNSFTSGEVSPKIHNRTDLDEYKQSVEEMLNFIPQKTGGAFRRMGSEYLYKLGYSGAEAWDNEDVVMIPYRSVSGDFTINIKIPNDYATSTLTFDDGDVDTGADTFTITAHGLIDGQRVYFRTDTGTGSKPTPLKEGGTYYIRVVDVDTVVFLQAPNTGLITALNLGTTGTGTFHLDITNDFTLGDSTVYGNSIPLRVFSRDFDSDLLTAVAASQGYEQEIIYPSFGIFQDIMPQLRASYNLSPKGFKYVQFGSDLFITHSSGLMSPIALRAVGINGDGATRFLFYSPMIAPADQINADYDLDGFSSTGKEMASLVRFMPFQNQNTNEKVKYSIKAGEADGPNDGSALGLIANATLEYSIIEARDASNTLIGGHFTDADIGSIIELSYPPVGTAATPTQGQAYILSVDSSSSLGDSVNVVILVGISPSLITTTAGTSRFSYSSFSSRSGYPRNVAFYQGRLHFGSTFEEPISYWASSVSDILNFRFSVLNQDISADVSGLDYYGDYVASDPFRAVIASKSVTGITFMVDDDLEMRVGTPEGDYSVGFGSEGDTGYGRDNKDIRPQSSFGSTSSQVFLANTRIVYLSLDSSSIRAIDTKTRDFKYLNTNLSILSDHMRYQPSSTITASDRVNSSEFDFFYWQDGENILWAINSRGNLVGMTIDNTLGITAWHKHVLGGSPTIISVCSAFNLSARYEDCMVVTRRVIDGTTVQYVEAIGETFNNVLLNTDDTGDKETEDKPRYVDAFIKVNQASSTTVAGLSHLEGETVSIFYNGIYEEGLVVASGQVVLQAAATEAIVGIKYTSRLKTLILDRGQQYGSSRGNTARTDLTTISLYNSSYGTVRDGDDGSPNSLELTETELYNGDIRHDLSQSPSRSAKIIIETDKPLPLNILGITTRGVSYDG